MMVIFRKLGEKGGPRALAPIEWAGQFLALTRWNHAVSEVQQVMMSPVQRLQMGERGMSLPEHDCASCR